MVWHALVCGVVAAALGAVAMRTMLAERRSPVVRAAGAIIGCALLPAGLVSIAAGLSTDDWVELTPRLVLASMLAREEAAPTETIAGRFVLPVPVGRPHEPGTSFGRLLWYRHFADMHRAWYELATNHPEDQIEELLPVARRIQEINVIAGGGRWADAWPARGVEWEHRARAEREDASRTLPVGMWAASEMESLTVGIPEQKWDLVYPPPAVLARFAASDDEETVLFALRRLAALTPDPYHEVLIGLRDHPSTRVREVFEQSIDWHNSLRMTVEPNVPRGAE